MIAAVVVVVAAAAAESMQQKMSLQQKRLFNSSQNSLLVPSPTPPFLPSSLPRQSGGFHADRTNAEGVLLRARSAVP
jgi:hypothetical protein